MTVPSLRELYARHQGKASDKWGIYLDVYEHLFSAYRDKPVRLLEIGVQNGGSLEIWTQYFRNAVSFVGCDIDPNCGKLRFDDPRVRVIVGDANAPDVQAAILTASPEFDIIIDDGSHTSGDIVDSFHRYFPRLQRGGIYVAEDLHCSYWREFGGGLFDPRSSISFFKRLVDVINHEHWGVQGRRASVLRTFGEAYGLEFDDQSLTEVHSVEFVNSMCIVRKDAESANVLGRRHFTGSVDDVVQRSAEEPTDNRNLPLQNDNRWSRLDPLPEEELHSLSSENERMRTDLADLQQRFMQVSGQLSGTQQELAHERDQLQLTRSTLAETERHVRELHATLSWRVTRPLRAMRNVLGTQNKSKNGESG